MRHCICVLVIILFATPLIAQEACPLPPSPFSGERNIFSPQQEMYLGELLAEQGARDRRVIDDDELNRRLQSVGENLLKHLPPTDVKYTFTLIDLPVINSFGIPGGRIYVTRKMVAFLKNDDELAALLAHEIGHIYTHQQAIYFTRVLHQKLNIDAVTDREDIRRDLNRLLDQWNLKSGHFDRSRTAKEQVVADQLGLYAMARAGYPPAAMAPFFDRLAETHGNTGSFLSDLFGATGEDNRRLRDIEKNTAAMPAQCIDPVDRVAGDSFQSWQQAVVAFSETGLKADLGSALIRKAVLDPPLQDEFRQIRFSPNGKFLLVQDDSGITVLTRQPLASLFRIHAPEATPAGFSPDSSFIVFYTNGLRVERWSIAEQKRVSVHEILQREPCLQSALSPDGNSFVCLTLETALRIFDVSNGSVIYDKKDFTEIDWFMLSLQMLGNQRVGPFHLINIKFDPSGRILIAASSTNNLVFDLDTRSPIAVPSSMKARFSYPFTFLSSNRLVMASNSHPGVYEFPSGKLLSSAKLGGRSMEHAAHGDLVFLRPTQKHAVGLFDLKQQKIIVGTDKQAIDAYDDVVASEGRTGSLLLSRRSGDGWDVLANTDLPRPELTHLDAVAVSADMNWLALSLHERGGVYNLNSNRRSLFVRGFRGAFFVSGPALLADYPKNDETPRTIAKLDLEHNTGVSDRTIPDDVKAFQSGPFLVLRKPEKARGSLYANVTVEVQDITTGQPLFSEHIPGRAPAIYMDPQSNLMVLALGATTLAENSSPDLVIDVPFFWQDQKRSVYDLEIVDLISGTKIRDLHVDSGKFSFVIRDISASRDYLALSDSENRVRLYSMKSGEQIGFVFGGPAYMSPAGLMSVVSQKGKIDLYDCATLKKLQQFTFPSAAIYSHLSKNGERLLVLTADQTAYELRTHPQPQPGAQTAAN